MCIDYDPPDFYQATTRKAAKPHRCEECSRLIETREPYEHVAGKWDGGFGTFATCQHCVAARRWLEVVCGGRFAHGGVLEDLREHYRSEGYVTVAMGRLLRWSERSWVIRGERVSPERVAALTAFAIRRAS